MRALDFLTRFSATPLLLCLLPLFSCSSSQGQTNPLPLDAILATRTFGDRNPLALSPDGQLIAYTVLEPARRTASGENFTPTGVPIDQASSDIWLSELNSAKGRSLTQSKGSNWDPVWSPDGKRLAFYSDRDGKARLWVWERETNRLHRVSPEIVRVEFGFEVPRWTADSKSILAKVIPERMSYEELAALTSERAEDTHATNKNLPSVTVFQSKAKAAEDKPVAGWTNNNLCDLVAMDVASGAVHRIVKKSRLRGFWLSPDNRSIALTIFKEIKPGTQDPLFDISWVPFEGGEPRVLAPDTKLEYGISVSWSPDGQLLSFLTNDGTEDGKCDLCLASVRDGRVRLATRSAHPNFTHSYRPPVWDARGETLYYLGENQLWSVKVQTGEAKLITTATNLELAEILGPSEAGRFSSPDGRSMILRTLNQETRKAGFYRVDLGSGEMRQLIEEEKSYGGFEEGLYSETATLNGNVLVFQAEDSGHGPDLWVADNSFRAPRQLTRLNPQLEGIPTGKSRLIEYADSSGKKLRAALLLPVDYNPAKKYPVLTWVYGGADGSRYVYNFGFETSGLDNMQLYATRGYAVLYPDIPTEVGTPVADMARTVSAAVQKVIEMGVADPNRVAVMGQSYGGYTVLALITHSNIFKAAIARASEGDLIASYGQMRENSGEAIGVGWSEKGQGKMGGTLWEFRERYIQNSPVFFLDKVETPLLLVHGARDATVPAYLADEIFVGLRRLGKDVTYLRYTQGGHWEGDWQYSDMRDEFQRILEFLSSRLQPKP